MTILTRRLVTAEAVIREHRVVCWYGHWRWRWCGLGWLWDSERDEETQLLAPQLLRNDLSPENCLFSERLRSRGVAEHGCHLPKGVSFAKHHRVRHRPASVASDRVLLALPIRRVPEAAILLVVVFVQEGPVVLDQRWEKVLDQSGVACDSVVCQCAVCSPECVVFGAATAVKPELEVLIDNLLISKPTTFVNVVASGTRNCIIGRCPLSTNILRKKWILAKSGIEARLSTDQRSGMAWRYERATSCRPKIISGQRRRLFQCACGVWRSIRDNKPRLTQKIRRIDHAQRMPTAWGDRPAAPLRRRNVLGQPVRVFWWARASDCVEHFF